MIRQNDRRQAPRIRFSWPLWFGPHQQGRLTAGQVVDLSRQGVSFTVASPACPTLGAHLFTRFSYPAALSDNFELGSYFHWAQVLRVDPAPGGRCRVALRLHQPLPDDFTDLTDSECPTLPVC